MDQSRSQPHDPKDPQGRTVPEIYADIADWFDTVRNRSLVERPLLDIILADTRKGSAVLDLGCGMGEPVARYLIENGARVTGVDAVAAFVALCRERFPEQVWIRDDIRRFTPEQAFDAVIVWDCLFHLPCAAQRVLLPKVGRWVRPGGYLLFNAGSEESEFWDAMGDHESARMFNASLSTREYRDCLAQSGFTVLKQAVSDPAVGGRSYFLARKDRGEESNARTNTCA